MLQLTRMWVCGVIDSDGTEIPEIFCVIHHCWVGNVFRSEARHGEAGTDERLISVSLSRSASQLTCSSHVSSEDHGGKRELTRTEDCLTEWKHSKDKNPNSCLCVDSENMAQRLWFETNVWRSVSEAKSTCLFQIKTQIPKLYYS